MKDQIPWPIKYRPKNLDEIVLTPLWEELFKEQVQMKDLSPLALVGGPGKGKSTLARLVVKKYVGKEKGAVFDFGGESMQEPSLTNIKGLNESLASGGFDGGATRCVLVDEADRMNTKAQEELRSVMDRFGREVKFVLTTNYPHKILTPLLSRFQVVFDFDDFKPDIERCVERLKDILTAEERSIDETRLRSLVEEHREDWRQLLGMVKLHSRAIPQTTPQ